MVSVCTWVFQEPLSRRYKIQLAVAEISLVANSVQKSTGGKGNGDGERL